MRLDSNNANNSQHRVGNFHTSHTDYHPGGNAVLTGSNIALIQTASCTTELDNKQRTRPHGATIPRTYRSIGGLTQDRQSADAWSPSIPSQTWQWEVKGSIQRNWQPQGSRSLNTPFDMLLRLRLRKRSYHCIRTHTRRSIASLNR